MTEPTGDRRAPRYKPTLVDTYRYHLRTRRAENPAVPVLQLFQEIEGLGYNGSLNLLYRDITQGRAEGDKQLAGCFVQHREDHGGNDPSRDRSTVPTCGDDFTSPTGTVNPGG